MINQYEKPKNMNLPSKGPAKKRKMV